MLAVIIDRHSRVAIPPETQFFNEFMPDNADRLKVSSKMEWVELALSDRRIADLNLDRNGVLNLFAGCEKTPYSLFAAILQAYADDRHKARPGEKSPTHLKYVPQILSAYPEAKVICIVRDGRDVVRSLEKVAWAEPGNPRRFRLFCMQWSDAAQKAVEYSNRFSRDKFCIVKYEEILSEPENQIARLCEFIGERFEPSQLAPDKKTGVVPEWEADWKGKASHSIDKSRVHAWRIEADNAQVWAMNSMMGKMLRKFGYPHTSLKGCPFRKKLQFLIMRIPYMHFMRPYSLALLKMIRSANVPFIQNRL
jgi:hypothetical protein